jgi:hypothetical protein
MLVFQKNTFPIFLKKTNTRYTIACVSKNYMQIIPQRISKQNTWGNIKTDWDAGFNWTLENSLGHGGGD